MYTCVRVCVCLYACVICVSLVKCHFTPLLASSPCPQCISNAFWISLLYHSCSPLHPPTLQHNQHHTQLQLVLPPRATAATTVTSTNSNHDLIYNDSQTLKPVAWRLGSLEAGPLILYKRLLKILPMPWQVLLAKSTS